MIDLIARARGRLEAVPYTLPALPLRLAVATVFWMSGTTKLANWDTAVALFADEYRLPLLAPELVAYMAASVELSTPVLLMLGLFTRPAAAVLLQAHCRWTTRFGRGFPGTGPDKNGIVPSSALRERGDQGA